MANATRKTPVVKARRHLQPEADIEQLLAAYPYLIQAGLTRPERQHCPTRQDRLDLLFRQAQPPLVVEIKAVKCGVASVRQLLRYLDRLEPEHPHIRGILIGFGMNEGAERLVRRHKARVSFLKLDHDVPTPARVVFCADCRMAYFRTSECPNGHEGVI